MLLTASRLLLLTGSTPRLPGALWSDGVNIEEQEEKLQEDDDEQKAKSPVSVGLKGLVSWAEGLEDDDGQEEELEEDDDEQKARSPVSIGLKGLVVAGTLYGIAGLYTGPDVQQETRRGDEATGERGKQAIREFVGTAAEDDIPPTLP